MEKIFNHKSYYFVWKPLGSRVNLYILPQVATLPPVLLTPCHRYQQHQRNWWQKFATGVVDTGGAP
jgi:hypothetical protein